MLSESYGMVQTDRGTECNTSSARYKCTLAASQSLRVFGGALCVIIFTTFQRQLYKFVK